jgi:hypothetical protein
MRVGGCRGRTEPLPRHGAGQPTRHPPVCPHSPSARRVCLRAGADRFNPCESASNPLRLRLEVLQPSLQPLANGRERLRRAIRTSPLKGGQVLGQKSEQLEQRDARVRDVVVRPLRRMNGNPCQQRIPKLIKPAVVKFRCRLSHCAILPQSRSRRLPLGPLVRYCSADGRSRISIAAGCRIGLSASTAMSVYGPAARLVPASRLSVVARARRFRAWTNEPNGSATCSMRPVRSTTSCTASQRRRRLGLLLCGLADRSLRASRRARARTDPEPPRTRARRVRTGLCRDRASDTLAGLLRRADHRPLRLTVRRARCASTLATDAVGTASTPSPTRVLLAAGTDAR